VRRLRRAAAARRPALIVTANDFDSIFAMNRIVQAIGAKAKNYNVRLGGVIANRSARPTRSTSSTNAIGLKTMARTSRPRRDPPQPAEEVHAVRDGGHARAASRAEGIHAPGRQPVGRHRAAGRRGAMKDRDIFDLLGFD
jgi:light-independent protochlorophyllide reductase subunit L